MMKFNTLVAVDNFFFDRGFQRVFVNDDITIVAKDTQMVAFSNHPANDHKFHVTFE
jgi:hypothetical protein